MILKNKMRLFFWRFDPKWKTLGLSYLYLHSGLIYVHQKFSWSDHTLLVCSSNNSQHQRWKQQYGRMGCGVPGYLLVIRVSFICTLKPYNQKLLWGSARWDISKRATIQTNNRKNPRFLCLIIRIITRMISIPCLSVGLKLFWTSPNILDMGQRAKLGPEKLYLDPTRPRLFLLRNSTTDG